jgi:choline transport protein
MRIVPYQAWFSKVDERRNIPTNMLYISTFINFLLGFLYLGSRAGFNIILGSSGIFYSKPIARSCLSLGIDVL